MAPIGPQIPTGSHMPEWWTTAYDDAWREDREAIEREWQQQIEPQRESRPTEGHEGDAFPWRLRGAAGAIHLADSETAAETAGTAPPPGAWDEVEHAARYGHGAWSRYGREHPDWDEQVERELSTDWHRMQTGRPWSSARPWVRRGWDAARARHMR